jgi:hypothetical protein
MASSEKEVEPHAPQVVEAQHDVESFSPADRNKDVAMAVVGEHGHAIDPVVEKRVIRKIDSFMIPAMIIGYGFVYYDKVGS